MLEFLSDSRYAQLIYSIGIVFLAFILRVVIKIVIKNIILKLTAKTETELDDKVVLSFKRHSKYIIIFLALYYILRINSVFFSEDIRLILADIFYIIFFIIVISMIFFTISVVIDWYMAAIAKRSDSSMVSEFGPLIQRLIKGLVIILGATVLLDHFNVDIKGLVVSLGVGSLALAFAAQDTLGNMIAGFVIMMDRPFRKGDRIKLENGHVGDVYDIGLRSIKIMDFENTIHIIPNKEIANRTVINYSYPDQMIRIKIVVGVAYGSNVEMVKDILKQQFKSHPVILEEPEPESYFLNMGESSLDFRITGYVAAYKDQWKITEELRIKIYNALVEAGISIPFPHRTLTISDDLVSKLKNK